MVKKYFKEQRAKTFKGYSSVKCVTENYFIEMMNKLMNKCLSNFKKIGCGEIWSTSWTECRLLQSSTWRNVSITLSFVSILRSFYQYWKRSPRRRWRRKSCLINIGLSCPISHRLKLSDSLFFRPHFFKWTMEFFSPFWGCISVFLNLFQVVEPFDGVPCLTWFGF